MQAKLTFRWGPDGAHLEVSYASTKSKIEAVGHEGQSSPSVQIWDQLDGLPQSQVAESRPGGKGDIQKVTFK